MSLLSLEKFFQEDTENNNNIELANVISADDFFSNKLNTKVPSVTQQGSSNVITSEDFFKDKSIQKPVIEEEKEEEVILPTFKPQNTQLQLASAYAKEYPEFFENGKLIDKIGAEKAGIVAEITTTEDGTPLAPELYSLRYRNKDELDNFKELVTKSNLPLRFKNYVPVEEQTKRMLKQDLSQRPIFNKYRETFGETGLDVLGYFSNAFNYVRGGFADAYQAVHEAIDDVTDGGATKATNMDASTAAKRFTGDVGQVLEVAEAAPFVRLTATVKGAKQVADEIINAEVKKKKKILKTATIAKALHDRTFNTTAIKQSMYTQKNIAKQKAKDMALENADLKEQLIKEFEQTIGARSTGNIDNIIDENLLVSKTSFGRLVLDPDKSRKVGRDIASEYASKDNIDVKNEMEMLGIKENPLVNPILNEDYLNPLIAIVKELKDKNPKAFGKNKTLIDDLFRLTVNKELQASPELNDLLIKYDMPYEKFMLAVVGSGSHAAKVMNKFSQMKKARMTGERLLTAKEMKKVNEKALGWRYWLRFVNIGRGAMVTQISTMARNIRSGLYRAPMEGFGNIMDTTLSHMADGKILSGSLQLVSPTNWKNSFKHIRYMYDDMGDYREFADLLLDRPEFADELVRLYTPLSEIQKVTGRGEATGGFGKVMDFILSEGEDIVEVLNTANRWQEHVLRTAYFDATLERLIKNEWGVDLIKELKNNKFDDFLSNSSSVKPAKARKFEELVTDSIENALRNTYASQPQIGAFRTISNTLAKTGLTALPMAAFPRFLFTSIELIGKYVGGSLGIPIRRVFGDKKLISKLDATDRDLITKNIVGLGALYAMMEYDKSQYSATDYRKIKMEDGAEIDASPEFPIRQLRYLARLGNSFLKGWNTRQKPGYPEFTLEEKFKNGFDYLGTTNLLTGKEILETFFGSNLRLGRDFNFIEEYASIFSESDLTKDEKVGKGFGSALSEFAQRYFVPYGMVIDAERALGIRTERIKETAEETDLTMEGAFDKALRRPFRRRGIMGIQEEAELNDKVSAFDPDGKNRLYPGRKLLFGLSYYETDPPPADLFKQFGFDVYELSSKASSVIVRDGENRLLQVAVPIIAENVKQMIAENDALQANDPEKKNRIEIRKTIREFIKFNIGTAKQYFGDLKYFYNNKDLTAEEQDEALAMGMFEKQITSFRKQPPLFRVKAISEFKKMFKRPITVTPTYPEDIKNDKGDILYKKGDINMDITELMKLGKSTSRNIFRKPDK